MMRTTSAASFDRAMLTGNVHYPVLVRSGDTGRDELTRRAAGLAPDAFWLVSRAGLPEAHTAWAERLLGPVAPVRRLTAPDTPDAPGSPDASWAVRPAPGSVVVALGGTGVLDAAARLAVRAADTARGDPTGRGPRLILLPTTPRAMTDTAFTLERPGAPGTAPALVWAQLDLLTTLPPSALRSGLAALVRNVLAVSPAFYDSVGALLRPDLTGYDALPLARAVALSAEIRATLMCYDPREQGPATAFRYGRTVADALLSLRTGLGHGDALALGMLAAARIAVLAGLLGPAAERAHHELLDRWGAPRELPAPLTAADVATALRRGPTAGPVPLPHTHTHTHTHGLFTTDGPAPGWTVATAKPVTYRVRFAPDVFAPDNPALATAGAADGALAPSRRLLVVK
ncbi:hypothetical protein AB0A69_20680 [Streptomyces sp. NPDC045431]|uniref:3-dehydroquinate synthase family protein n=1 Tax=Streptomyces sp. NPDC045431 TaxID=3155613 RepID=UPI0033DE94F9